MKTLTAKNARNITEKIISSKYKSRTKVKSFNKSIEDQLKISDREFQKEIRNKIKFIESQIKMRAKSGIDWVDEVVPSDSLYFPVKEYFERLGYHISKYKTDEGYCIGDVEHICISW